MHVVVRRYTADPALVDATVEKGQVVRDLTSPEPRDYAAARTCDGGAGTTVTVCDDKAGTMDYGAAPVSGSAPTYQAPPFQVRGHLRARLQQLLTRTPLGVWMAEITPVMDLRKIARAGPDWAGARTHVCPSVSSQPTDSGSPLTRISQAHEREIARLQMQHRETIDAKDETIAELRRQGDEVRRELEQLRGESARNRQRPWWRFSE